MRLVLVAGGRLLQEFCMMNETTSSSCRAFVLRTIFVAEIGNSEIVRCKVLYTSDRSHVAAHSALMELDLL